jgi:hypothetical protein
MQFRQSMEAIKQDRGSATNEIRSTPGVQLQGAAAVIISYSRHHRHATYKLFNDFAQTLGF